jgi:putative hydrolase
VTPEQALLRVLHCLDRSAEGGFRSRAFVRALEVVRDTDPDELADRVRRGTLEALDGIGPSTAAVISEALAGRVPAYLLALEESSRIPVSAEGERYLAALRGDCHLHSTWSDGGAPIEAMVTAGIELGHEYLVLTDHSARLTIAHGLDGERLERQLDDIERLNGALREAGHHFRLLSGMEVDIFEDGSLDLADELLERLDVVVASVHSKLRMSAAAMTDRMVAAVSSPHVDILGHCTGRLVGKRPASTFDADVVFAACARSHTAVEINCRPERLDPPRGLLRSAVAHGCWFSIDSEAHATGQLEWQPYGCDRAADCEVPLDRVINTMTATDLLEWTRSGG